MIGEIAEAVRTLFEEVRRDNARAEVKKRDPQELVSVTLDALTLLSLINPVVITDPETGMTKEYCGCEVGDRVNGRIRIIQSQISRPSGRINDMLSIFYRQQLVYQIRDGKPVFFDKADNAWPVILKNVVTLMDNATYH